MSLNRGFHACVMSILTLHRELFRRVKNCRIQHPTLGRLANSAKSVPVLDTPKINCWQSSCLLKWPPIVNLHHVPVGGSKRTTYDIIPSCPPARLSEDKDSMFFRWFRWVREKLCFPGLLARRTVFDGLPLRWPPHARLLRRALVKCFGVLNIQLRPPYFRISRGFSLTKSEQGWGAFYNAVSQVEQRRSATFGPTSMDLLSHRKATECLISSRENYTIQLQGVWTLYSAILHQTDRKPARYVESLY